MSPATFESLATTYVAKMAQRNQFLKDLKNLAVKQNAVMALNTELETIAAEMAVLKGQGPVTTTTLPDAPAVAAPVPTVPAAFQRPAPADVAITPAA